MKSKLSKQSGMFLMEAMIAILIFSFGILGLVGLQAAIIANSVNAEDRTQAALLADQLIATMWLKGTSSLPSTDVAAWTTLALNSKIKATGTVSVDATSLATITLIWKAPTKKSTDASNQYITQVMVQ
ncbi:hypothetical protein [Undibacterium sp.]|uniref:type IV pilus modification PilV family protein n=1 Tax=Undibacterium sp. TaxID=1914977 RepID=UPI00374DE1A0